MTPFTASLILLLLLIVFSAAAGFFPNCNQTFSCGDLEDITYPFTGGNRPSSCGPPEFRLSCRNDLPELTISSLSYRVVQIDQDLETLTLARLDLWNNTCPNQFINSSFDSSAFSSVLGNDDLTMFYGCSFRMPITPYNQFYCNVGANSSDSYYLIGPIPSDPILKFMECNVSIRVLILKSSVISPMKNLSAIEDALMKGFNLSFSDPYGTKCTECSEFDGQCGFDDNLGEPICICDDQLCIPTGSGSVERSRNQQAALQIGIAVGGACIALLVVSAIFFVRRRKQAKAKQLSLPQSTSKDISTPPSSKEIPTSVTNYSRSTPSYLSSKSDLEKGSTYFGVQVFSYIELEEATDNFDPKRELGDGGFGTVYYGELKDGRVVAVKRLYENNFKRVEQFMNEVEILTRLRHENLVTLYGCTSRRSRELLLVYEYIPNGTVADHLHGNRSSSGLLTWPVRLNIALETAVALAYLHASEIIHRDVKSNNILLDNDFRVKVADFGLSRLFPTDVTHISTAPQGTPGYVDPEYYQCYQLTVKSDVYSFGVVLIELISSKQAVDTSRHRHDINLANMAVNKIQNQTLDELVDSAIGFDKDYAVRRMVTLVAELAFRCLQQERDMRPSMEEIVEVLRGIQNEELNAQKAEVVDIADDDVGLLKSIPPPLSPDSASTDKWMKIRTM